MPRSAKSKPDQAHTLGHARAHAEVAAAALLPPPVYVRGVCRVCGCSEARACVLAPELHEGFGDGPLTCGWIDPDRTLCSNPACVAEIPLAELEELCALPPRA